jgi:hypothetical protein
MERRLEDFVRVIDSFVPMQGSSHFCLFGHGVPAEDDDVKVVLMNFLQRGFPSVSVVRGGYKGIASCSLSLAS